MGIFCKGRGGGPLAVGDRTGGKRAFSQRGGQGRWGNEGKVGQGAGKMEVYVGGGTGGGGVVGC